MRRLAIITIVIMSEGVSVQSTPRLPLLWHVASSSPVFPHARRFSQTWPATVLDPPSTRSQPPQRTGLSGMLEFTHLEDEGQDQGNSVGLVQSFTPGAGYMVNLLWIEDMSLKDWLLSDHGLGNPGGMTWPAPTGLTSLSSGVSRRSSRLERGAVWARGRPLGPQAEGARGGRGRQWHRLLAPPPSS